MKKTNILCVSFLCVAATACEPQESAAQSGINLELAITRGLADSVAGFQVVLISKAQDLNCLTVQKSCVKDQVASTRLMALDDKKSKALFFPISLIAGTPNTQDLTLKNLELGSDFALVVEAVSSEATPRLFGSSCQFVKELVAGSNTTAVAKIAILDPPANCNPKL